MTTSIWLPDNDDMDAVYNKYLPDFAPVAVSRASSVILGMGNENVLPVINEDTIRHCQSISNAFYTQKFKNGELTPSEHQYQEDPSDLRVICEMAVRSPEDSTEIINIIEDRGVTSPDMIQSLIAVGKKIKEPLKQGSL